MTQRSDPAPRRGNSRRGFLKASSGVAAVGASAVSLEIARFAHARVTLLGCGQRPEALQSHLQEARKQLGSGLAALDVRTSAEPLARAIAQVVEQQPFDLSLRADRAKARQLERLGAVGWVDRKAGVAHIPIDAAMQLVVQGVRPAPVGGARGAQPGGGQP